MYNINVYRIARNFGGVKHWRFNQNGLLAENKLVNGELVDCWYIVSLKLLSSNLPELSSIDDIRFVRNALLPSATEEEATFHFTKLVQLLLENSFSE